MQLLGRRYEGRVAVRELIDNCLSSRIRHQSHGRSDFGKLQANRRCGVSGRVSKISGWLILLWLTWLPAVFGSSLPTSPSVTLAWNPSADANVTGYRLYYGNTSRNYSNVVTVGPNSTTVTGLSEGATYYFSVTTVNNLGLESNPSNEISYTVPSKRARLQLLFSPTKQVILRVTGQPGHLYEIQATHNFTNWSVIGVAVLGLGVSLDYIDTTAAGRPARFYRLREIL